MRALLAIYRAQFRTTFATQLQYRASLLIWLISMILEPVIYLVVWSTVARTSGGQVGGFSTRDFAAYFIAMMLVNHATFSWIMWEYDSRIRHGSLSFMLLRPVHPIHADIADNLTYKVLTLSVMVPTAIGLVRLFRPTMSPAPWAILAFVPALVLAFLVRFLIEWSLAMAAFWTTRVNAINQMYFVVLLFFSGRLAPLSLFPPAIQAAATWLPFRWVLSFPVELLLGRLTPQEATRGFIAQGIWLIVGLAVLRLVWRAGVRRYSAVGS